MSLRIEQSGADFLVIDTDDPTVPVDAYPTQQQAESFIQFIGQSDISIPIPEVSPNLVDWI